jgi:hypothetical protein
MMKFATKAWVAGLVGVLAVILAGSATAKPGEPMSPPKPHIGR